MYANILTKQYEINDNNKKSSKNKINKQINRENTRE